MITVTRMAAQGDVLFRRVDRIPNDAREQLRDGPLVVAHSETGHHHTIESPAARLFTTANPLVCYLRLEGTFADVMHLRSYDTHETLRLLGDEHGPTCFEVRRQREHAPDGGWMIAGD
jgi:hypothetical protein